MKKIQIGARINADDAEFLNLLEINGATTPSDKLRAIIEEARLRREYANDFSGSFRMIQEQVIPLTEKIKKIEFEKNLHSGLLARVLEWLPDFYAYCFSSLPENNQTEEDLIAYEKGAVDRVVRLFESLLHQLLSKQSTSYDPDILNNHLSSIAEIIKMIEMTSSKKEV